MKTTFGATDCYILTNCLHKIKSNQIKSNQIKSNQIKSKANYIIKTPLTMLGFICWSFLMRFIAGATAIERQVFVWFAHQKNDHPRRLDVNIDS